ncbi:MAG: NlpC/P60 family protein [Actinobacteria bacterium]|nr:NlpC/P60 family protein [Actinomycetota bacterium]
MTPRHRRRLGVLVGIALLLPLAAPLAASGDPIDDKRAEAARIQDQLDAQGNKVSIAAEQFNRAQLHLQDVEDSLAKAQTDLQRSDQRMQEVKGRLAQAAVLAYIQGGSNALISRLARSGNEDDLLARSQYLRVTANDQRAIIGELRSAKEDYTALRVKLTGEEKDARAAASAADASRRDAVAAEDAQRAILSKVQGDVADMVAAEAARRLAAEAARAPQPIAVAAGVASPAPVFDDAPTTAPAAVAAAPTAQVAASKPAAAVASAPPPSSSAGTAVQTAEAQVGKPYQYGGSGPDSFDCSGLTSYAWRAAGVSLSHDAYQQYFETTRIPIDSVQPGDLLFFGDDGIGSIHHVAMYVGGGQMVEAAQTGIPVRYRGWRASDLVAAGRPG